MRINGKVTYLGKYGSAESRARYREIVKAWEQETDQTQRFSARPGCTVYELVAAHAEHAREHYRTAEGEPTSEQNSFAMSLRPLLGPDYAEMPADSFRPSHLKQIREGMVRHGLARKTVNQSIGRIRRLFRWAAGEELVSGETAAVLGLVKDLSQGRTVAPDYDPVTPVPLRDLAAVLRHVRPDIAAMIRLQYYCGARPGEILRISSDEIDREGLVHTGKRKIQLPGGVWVFQPGRFKQQHKGKTVAYILGRRAQAVLPFGTGFLFPSPKKKGRPWTIMGYERAIGRACAGLGVPHWTPNQLRHNYLSRIDAAAGIQLASYAVGHSSTSTTAIYVERNLAAVAEVVAKLG